MPALRAIDPRKTVVRVAAFQEALDDALFEQPLQPTLGSQFRHVAIGALVKGARTGVRSPPFRKRSMTRSSSSRCERPSDRSSAMWRSAHR